METVVPYGRSSVSVSLPNDRQIDIIEPPDIPPASEPLQLVESALDDPLGFIDISAFAGAKSVAIAISDKTRPVPHQHLLPPLLGRLQSLGIPRGAIRLYIAVGTHAPMSPEEFPAVLPGPILERFAVVSHDAGDVSNLVQLGNTTHGTPIWANQEYAKADLKIVVGNIEPHQFAGFSGGVKSAAIGLAGNETITHNHALMIHPEAKLGAYENNPVRQDIEEIGEKLGVQFACNAILNRSRQIVHVLAGDPRAVMQAGVPHARHVCQVKVQAEYSLMISSPGGHPKDINLYQAQKGLAHAALVTRQGGTIILVAACPEGTGSMQYEAWMQGKNSYAEVIKQYSAGSFHIGPHKGYQIARDASQVRLAFYSEMDSQLSETLLLNPISDLQEVIDEVLDDMPSDEPIGVLPHALLDNPLPRELSIDANFP